ncbi:hypothetical protein ZHAS_00016297 [Anopheles sinensis]|uniref:Uncharacterized protein n=1 Tax=Anopheles sinensis TaxID=74873 RepID=A0A084WDM2_ANOSI|nr:hypothetical protein ZHAS_00016297 [Anopheles sinensis]
MLQRFLLYQMSRISFPGLGAAKTRGIRFQEGGSATFAMCYQMEWNTFDSNVLEKE